MQVPSWEIGRALGIPIRVHASWFVVFLLVTWSLSTGYLPDNLPGLTPERYWAMGGLAAILLFVSVLLHELGHSYVALYYRIPIEKITLFIFGGVAHMRQEAPTPRAEFLIALAGPVVSFVIGGLCFVVVELAETMQRQHGLQGWIMLGALLGFVNMQIGLFNMIPGFPLDGGRMLRAGLWAWGNNFYRATKQAAGVGLGFGVMLGLAGLVVLYRSASGGLPTSMASNGGWVVVIGMFLFSAALASRRQAVMRQALATVPIRDVMATTVTSIPSHCTLDVAVNQHFQSYGYGGFPVVEDGRLVGLITTVEIQSVPPSLWPWRRVEQVMRPRSESFVIEPDIPVMHALERMAREGWGRLVVMQDGEMVGLVTHSAIVRYLQLRGFPRR
ncbi:MAG: CBS domain-containing protein [Nitrospira sp.]|nr:MAG: CBS domain-containing protein [Nitrospira sp.]